MNCLYYKVVSWKIFCFYEKRSMDIVYLYIKLYIYLNDNEEKN